MLTLLRSNQPIAWAIVPLSILAMAGTAIACGKWTWEVASTWSLGTLVVAALAHRLYRSFEYTAYANPALSWLLSGMLFVAKIGQPFDGFWSEVRGWFALWAMLLGCWWMLGVHRQPRTSHLTFRAGTMAGLCWVLDPIGIGSFVASAIVLTKSRTFLFREWAMFLIGASWLPLSALSLSWSGRLLFSESSTVQMWPMPVFQSWLYVAGVLAMFGWAVLLRKTQFEGTRCKAARMNLTLLTVIPAAWACWSTPNGMLTPLLCALAVSFAWVWLIPNESNGRRNPWSWSNGLAWGALATWFWGIVLGIVGA